MVKQDAFIVRSTADRKTCDADCLRSQVLDDVELEALPARVVSQLQHLVGRDAFHPRGWLTQGKDFAPNTWLDELLQQLSRFGIEVLGLGGDQDLGIGPAADAQFRALRSGADAD